MDYFKTHALTATLAVLAITLTFSCSDDSGGGSNTSTKDACIRAELEVKANTLDDVAKDCDATRGEVLSLLPSTIGTCSKNDLDFGELLGDVMEACGVSEIPIVSNSSSSNGSSSSADGSSSSIIIERGTVEYHGYEYKTVKIGDQWWLAENLRYEASGSRCYNDIDWQCDIFGRLYDWNTAMNGASTSASTPSGVRGVCPPDWHLPSDLEWTKLTDYVGSNAGTKLKKCGFWYNIDNCTDDFGFSALPGGYGNGSDFSDILYYGFWWSSTEADDTRVMHRNMFNNSNAVSRRVIDKTDLISIRCVKN